MRGSAARGTEGSSRSSGIGYEIKVLDFGLAKITDSDEKRHMTVTSAGLVTGTGLGTATITATSEGRGGTATVQVNAPPP